ncbi:hypothetical protein DPEC_G00196960 [Dallia pectoralis]|uniref:Uncharacterized protein n=1 Tax=Dallia pectoralis TaxID=75939 RepID=A0ACC2G7H2_DALPE|nr:hypothetical protein DPEC_G00196960 [Dallia pectoralis]
MGFTGISTWSSWRTGAFQTLPRQQLKREREYETVGCHLVRLQDHQDMVLGSPYLKIQTRLLLFEVNKLMSNQWYNAQVTLMESPFIRTSMKVGPSDRSWGLSNLQTIM